MHVRAFLLTGLLAAAGWQTHAAGPVATNTTPELASGINAVPATVSNLPPPAAANSPTNPANADATNAFRGLQLRAGFRLQLVAAAPLVSNPVALAFDASGRLFVAEQSGDNAEGRVKLLEDTDGDGTFDRATVLADKLAAPSALICYGGGVFVAAGSQILFLADTTGDGVADLRRGVYGGFDTNHASLEPRVGVNHFTWGLDNQIHAATAGVGGSISCLAIPTSQTLALNGYDFAFNPRTLSLVIEAGGTHRGLSFDNAGRRFTASATRPVQLTVADPIRTSRNPLLIWPQLITDLTPGNLIAFPLFRPGSGTPAADGTNRMQTVPARFTRASSLLVYRGGALPTNFVSDVFIADPALRLVSRWHLREDGLTPALERPAAEAATEFLASSEPGFRPVQVVSGPDGTLYVADLAREKLDQADNHGRIWRISPVGLKPSKLPRMATFKTPDLVGLLANPNPWVRDTAARLLFERRDTNAIPLLAKQLARSKDALARVGSLHVLHGLDALTEADLITALADRDEAIRAHAAQLAEEFILHGDLSNALWSQLVAAINDSSLRVQFQATFTLGLIQRPGVPMLLASLARNAPDDPAMQMAVFTAAAGRANALFQLLVNDRRFSRSPAGWALLRELATMTGQEGTGGMDEVLIAIERSPFDPVDALTLARLVGEGLHSAGRTFVGTAPRQTWRGFARQALNIGVGQGSPAVRAEAIRFLGVSGYTSQEVVDWLLALLVPGESQAVQSAALESLSRFGDPRITTAFIQRWASLSATTQTEIIARMLDRFDRTMALVTALEENRLPRAMLSDVQINFLRAHRDAHTARRASAIYGPPGQRGLAERFADVLHLKGSAPRGRELFTARCANCHRMNGEGRAFGPDLDTAATRGREKLLQDILEPDTEIRPEYRTQVVQRTDNLLLFGLLSRPNQNLLVVRAPGAAPVFLPASQVQETLAQDWSLMPESTATGLTGSALADLIEFLAADRLPP